MKRLIATFIMIAMLAVMVPLTASTASAQTRRSYRSSRTYTQPVYKRPNVYQRHRNLFNVGIGAGAGAIIGALAGGKKGVLLGTLIGGGGAALYTYKLNPKKKTYYNRRY